MWTNTFFLIFKLTVKFESLFSTFEMLTLTICWVSYFFFPIFISRVFFFLYYLFESLLKKILDFRVDRRLKRKHPWKCVKQKRMRQKLISFLDITNINNVSWTYFMYFANIQLTAHAQFVPTGRLKGFVVATYLLRLKK